MKKKRLYIHGAKRPPDDRNVEDDCDVHLANAFTISSPPSKRSLETGKPDEEFELTIRKVGRATEYLFGQDLGFEVPLRGFEGEEAEWWHCSIYYGWRWNYACFGPTFVNRCAAASVALVCWA